MNGHDLVISDHRDTVYDPGSLIEIPSKPGLFLSDTSPNGKLVFRSNPLSFLVDLLGCVPFLSFNGSGSQASQDAAGAVAGQTAAPAAVPAVGQPITAQAPDLGVFGQAFGLDPSSNPSQTGSVGAPGATPNQPLSAPVGQITPAATPAAAKPLPRTTLTTHQDVIDARKGYDAMANAASPFQYVAIAKPGGN